MRYRTFGTTGITASEVGFGVWTLATGWWGEHSDDDAVALLRRGHDLGITFFDTADTYGEGRGERLLADAFGARDDVVVGTKFGYDIYSPWERKGHSERPHDWTPGFVRFALEQSLQRLGRETIDVYQLHNPRLDPLALRRALRAARELRAGGEDPHLRRGPRALPSAGATRGSGRSSTAAWGRCRSSTTRWSRSRVGS
jgi:aryl-alcohol dehydrogenase-like predicted oxidoreductase